MPRKKPLRGPRNASSTWYSRSFTFDLGGQIVQEQIDPEYAKDQRWLAKCKQKLAECIGLGPETENFVHVIREVERLLAQHWGAVQAVDNAPRPSDYTNSYRMLETQADSLSKSLSGLSPRILELLEARLLDSPYGDLESIERTLDALVRTLTDLRRDVESEGRSSGRPKNTAIRMTVTGLQAVFRKHYNGPRGAKPRRGAFKFADEMTKCELGFVTTVLKAAKITATGLKKLLA